MSAREDASIGTGIGTRVVLVHEPDDNSDSSTYEGSSEEEEHWENAPKGSDVPLEYWFIQKLVKYMKINKIRIDRKTGIPISGNKLTAKHLASLEHIAEHGFSTWRINIYCHGSYFFAIYIFLFTFVRGTATALIICRSSFRQGGPFYIFHTPITTF